MEIFNTAEKALAQCKQNGAEKALVTVSSTEAKEFNIEANKLTLLRTTFDQNLSIKTIVDQRQSTISGNQFSDEGINSATKSVVAATKASQQDPANGFAPSQGQKTFSFGTEPQDEAWMYSRLNELLKERSEKFPSIIIDGGTIKYVRNQKVLASSEGTHLSSDQGYYEGFMMFTSKSGKQTSSFNYTSFNLPASTVGKKVSLLDISDLRELLKQSTEQMVTQKVPEKFVGDVIVTPHCLESFIGGWNDFLGTGRMLKKSSFFQDKLNQPIASTSWNLRAMPVESSFATRKFWTQDGYLAENEVIIENGILKNYLLGHYAAQKLNHKVSRSEGQYLSLQNGNKSLQEMIGSVKKGILMCRYSSGNPAENGEISGVAKNSYYIRDGKIQFPVGETMVSANLADMLKNVQQISQETVKTGYWELPWVQFSGVTVS